MKESGTSAERITFHKQPYQSNAAREKILCVLRLHPYDQFSSIKVKRKIFVFPRTFAVQLLPLQCSAVCMAIVSEGISLGPEGPLAPGLFYKINPVIMVFLLIFYLHCTLLYLQSIFLFI